MRLLGKYSRSNTRARGIRAAVSKLSAIVNPGAEYVEHALVKSTRLASPGPSCVNASTTSAYPRGLYNDVAWPKKLAPGDPAGHTA